MRSLNNLADLLQRRGELAAAQSLYTRVLRVREVQLGEADPMTLRSVNNLAGVLWEQGRLEGAEAMYRRALVGTAEQLGATHPDTLTAFFNLAKLLSESSPEKGEELYQQALGTLALGPKPDASLDLRERLDFLRSQVEQQAQQLQLKDWTEVQRLRQQKLESAVRAEAQKGK